LISRVRPGAAKFGPGVCCEVCGQVWSARSSSVKEVPVAQRVSGGAGEAWRASSGELGLDGPAIGQRWHRSGLGLVTEVRAGLRSGVVMAVVFL